jgi:hypothetical protein
MKYSLTTNQNGVNANYKTPLEQNQNYYEKINKLINF